MFDVPINVNYVNRSGIENRAIINLGGYNWKYQGATNRNNNLDTTAYYAGLAAVTGLSNYIPNKLAQSLAQGVTAWIGFTYKPTTYYYTHKRYTDSDHLYFYGKVDTYVYSDSARTKLIATNTELVKTAR